ncbi:MAG: dockerin type I repeat-containing protein [Ruminococcus sp.]|nr:dockerin type I repeat-containing protein [Ruminococcus sp.]
MERFKAIGIGKSVSIEFLDYKDTTIMNIYSLDVVGDEDIVYGDANEDGKINISDAVLIMQSISNPTEYKLTEQGIKNADVVDNDGVTNNDALAIQMIEAKLLKLSDLPVTADQLNRK